MWSGPRNLSTAMMYAFGNRADFHVVDEPFYGPYLRMTGLPHPMAVEIMASRPESAETVQAQLLGPMPKGRPHVYHKHMCQHMIDGMPRAFMKDCVHVFLLRHPARVVASFSKGYENPTAADIGFAAQAELYDYVLSLGLTPYVIDSADIRRDPESKLRALCEAIGLDFDPAMLSWPAGGHAQDGAWAPHWYGSVHRSTGFAGPEGDLPELSGAAADLANEALPHYEKMRDSALI
ncbi:Branched-chain-amino-acid aminotransferase-like protein 2 [Salipiger abyssi]|uniref:Branched-chain-amino-acid aminotransferase-like protein 2 n=2 Tax=Salipiger abyssi TaxID=1250539 RepID=A0A1P8UT96_9RHOB|nr:Branched-chain-amino-acid aminotransferase-like protein 2 [Salipiger abyssi]